MTPYSNTNGVGALPGRREQACRQKLRHKFDEFRKGRTAIPGMSEFLQCSTNISQQSIVQMPLMPGRSMMAFCIRIPTMIGKRVALAEGYARGHLG
jgi:hypothetical protein